MKIVYIFVIALCAVFTVFLPAAAQPEPVDIFPGRFQPDGTTISVAPGQEVVLFARWGACAPGLTRAFTRSARLEWSIDGQALFTSQKEVSQYWSAPFSKPITGESSCVNGSSTAWLSYWEYPLSSLAPGKTYTIHLVYAIDHPMIDGGDYDGNGAPDTFEGIFQDATVFLQVTNYPER